MRVDSGRLRKRLILNIPYLVFGLICTNLGEAWRMAEGINASEKLLSFFSTLGIAFASPLPSFHMPDLMMGASHQDRAAHDDQPAKESCQCKK